MRSRWMIQISDPRGFRLEIANGEVGNFALAGALNTIGEFSVDLPWEFDLNLARDGNMIEFWRAPEGHKMDLVQVGFIQQRDRFTRSKQISGPDCMDLLKTRIIAYDAATSYTAKTDYFDDMMKVIVRENFGPDATDTDREVSDYNFSVAPDLSAAPSGTLAFTRANVYDTLVKIAEASREAGTELYFTLTPKPQSDSTIGFLFETWINQPGQDRTEDSDNPLIFSEQNGTLSAPHLMETSRDEINDVYAGGSGIEADRVVVQVENTERISRTIWNRREGFVELSNSSSTAALTAAAQAEITARRPRKLFSGQLVDSPRALYGVDWKLGYRVTVAHDSEQFDGLVKMVAIAVTGGNESIVSDMEIEA